MIFQIIINIKEIRQSQNIYKRLIDIAKKSSEQSISVLIELKQNMKSVVDLLDHLYGYKYSKLEIIVVVDNDADENADAMIKSYRHTRHIKNLRLVHNRHNLKVEEILRRYGSGTLAMLLSTDNRLSKDFFSIASIESLYKDSAIVALPWHHICLNKTVTSALRVQRNIIRQFITIIFPINISLWPLRAGIVYNRQKIIDKSGQKDIIKVFSNQRLYVSDIFPPKMFSEYIRRSIKEASRLSTIAIFVGLAGFITVSFLFLKTNELIILAIFIIFIYMLTSLLLQMRLSGYSFIDNINLLLIAPFELIFLIVIYTCGFVKLIIEFIYSKFKKDKLLNDSIN